MLYIPHGRIKVCRMQSGSREYLCTCTSDSWDAPGETCAECEMASEDFEDDIPFDFYEWLEMHLDAEEAMRTAPEFSTEVVAARAKQAPADD